MRRKLGTTESPKRRLLVRASAVARCALVVEVGASLLAVLVDPRAVVIATLACATLAAAAFYAAYEGFDEALRRPR